MVNEKVVCHIGTCNSVDHFLFKLNCPYSVWTPIMCKICQRFKVYEIWQNKHPYIKRGDITEFALAICN